MHRGVTQKICTVFKADWVACEAWISARNSVQQPADYDEKAVMDSCVLLRRTSNSCKISSSLSSGTSNFMCGRCCTGNSCPFCLRSHNRVQMR